MAPLLHANWRLKPPLSPSISSISPVMYNPGMILDSIVPGSKSATSIPPAATTASAKPRGSPGMTTSSLHSFIRLHLSFSSRVLTIAFGSIPARLHNISGRVCLMIPDKLREIDLPLSPHRHSSNSLNCPVECIGKKSITISGIKPPMIFSFTQRDRSSDTGPDIPYPVKSSSPSLSSINLPSTLTLAVQFTLVPCKRCISFSGILMGTIAGNGFLMRCPRDSASS